MTTEHRYSTLGWLLRSLFRKLSPIAKSPWTSGEVKDMCTINLVPPEKLTEFFKHCLDDLYHWKGNDIGDYLEFGVFNGNSISSMYYARQVTGMIRMRLFGFDAFEGLPSESERDDDGKWKKGFYSCSFEQMEDCLKQRRVPSSEITWVKGWYSEVLTPQLARKHSFGNFGIVFIDCDTYGSTKSVLDFIAPLIKNSFIICLDDWKLNNLDLKGMGEYRAFNEFLDENPRLHAKELHSYNRKSKTFLITVGY